MQSGTPGSNLPAVTVENRYPAPSLPPMDAAPDRGPVELAHYLWVLRRQAWRIAAFVVVCVVAALIISLRITPIYESTVVIDIDRRMPTAVIGQDARPALTNDADQFLATQAQIIQSDSVLRPVVEKYRLLEREEEYGGLDPEELRALADAPIELRQLKVKRPPNTYLLEVSYRASDPGLAADVANAIAESYLRHTYEIRYTAAAGLSQFMERQLEELRANMERSSNALAQYERELEIINPEEKTNILAARLLDLNTEYTKAQAERVSREAAYRALQGGSLEAAMTSRGRESLRKLHDEYAEAKQRFAAVQAHYGENHPEYRTAAAHLEELRRLMEAEAASIQRQAEIEYRRAVERERMLQEELRRTKQEFDDLNARSFEYQALKREADGDKALYEELLRKIKEATINASFENNAARIADPARPGHEPVFPNVLLNVLLTFLAATLLGVGVAIVADLADDTIRDPEEVTRTLHTAVIGSLPEVKPWRGQLAKVVCGANSNGTRHSTTVSTYEEAIRTLRNSILLTDFDQRLRTILVTSAAPSEGKSTIAIHLAIAHAQQHRRTLIIDGDLRRPSVHKRFAVQGAVGLADVVIGRKDWREAVIRIPDLEDLAILPAGRTSTRRAADFIGPGLDAILDEAAREYDLVIIDAPPLLGFPEPLQMAAAVDGVVVVTKAAQTSRRAVASVLQTLARLRANVIGLVLNEVNRETSDKYYYYYSYYRKYYRHRDSEGAARDEAA